jgi:hypothetical protein
MQPPWKKHPEIRARSMGWRMGYGEQYITAFNRWFLSKQLSDKRAYAAEHPEPDDWDGFYTRRGVSGQS